MTTSTQNLVKVVEPATVDVLAEFRAADADAADEAVARAKAAFPAWRAVDPASRGAILLAIGDAIEERLEDLARLETRNVGKPIADSRGEVGMVAHVFRYYAGAPERLLGDTIPVAGGIDMTFREPMGVVGMIVPWNFPLPIASWKVAPALAAGNTIVLKPAELTPLTSLELEKIAVDAGLPEGVLNVVAGPGRIVGERLVEHPDVAKIAFTGSTAVGRRIGELAAQSIKRVTLELGGKSANVIFADADLEKAASSAPGSVFGNAGQDCCARSRILVQKSIYERFTQLLTDATRHFKVGDPEAEGTDMGPLISASHRKLVASFVDGKTMFKGTVPSGPGFWFPCTLIEASSSDRVAREEVFGPVAAIIPFEDEADGIRVANDTPYGLSGSIWTRDAARAMRVARAIDTGVLALNSNTSVRVATPFGGFKQSGFGRELSMHAMDGYSELKNVFLSTEG